VVLLEHAAEGRRDAEEGQPLLREDVARSAVEPGFRTGFLLLAARLRQIAKHTVGQQADLVVVVENHAPVAGDAKILEQQIAREHIAHGQIAQRVAVIDDGRLGRGRFGFAQE